MIPAKTPFSRVFLTEGRARADHKPDYKSCIRGGSPEQSFGDVEPIECPSPDVYGEFDEIGEIQGAVERATMDLIGKYAADVASDLLRLAKARCAADVQIHFGACTDPRAFNTFTKAFVLEVARLTNWSAGDLGALKSDGAGEIEETSPLSAREIYEILPLSFAARCGDVVVNPMEDVVICSTPSCGDCDEEDDGCEFIVAVSQSATGSPGTGPEIVYSTDKGQTCNSDEITTLGLADTTSGVACIGDYVVVISDSDDALHYKLIADVKAGTAGNWTRQATGILAAGSPNDIWSVGTYAFIVGDGGYVYGTDDPTAGVTVLDAGVATNQNLNKVHAVSDQVAVAVGAADAVVYTTTQTVWAAAAATGSGVALTAVWIKAEDSDQWWAGTAAGAVYYSLDAGQNWTVKGLPGAGYADINDIAFATNSVGYISATVAGPRARLLRTFDGGYSWVILPEAAGATLPLADEIEAIAACKYDANFVVGVGLADDGADGIMIIGQD